MKDNNDVKVFDSHVATLETSASKDLEKYFSDKNEQFSRIKVQKYVAVNQNRNKNSSNKNLNDSLVSIYNNKNLTKNMESVANIDNCIDSNDAPYFVSNNRSDI